MRTFLRAALALYATAAGLSLFDYSEPDRAVAASTFVVSITSDPAPGACTPAHCSLREAIKAANADPDVSIVNIPDLGPAGADTLMLTRTGALENANVSGDLDILTSLTIKGMGASNTIIDGNGAATLDRVVQADCFCPVRLQQVTLTGGAGASGAGLYVGGANNVTLIRVTIDDNHASGNGGGINNFEGQLYAENSTISGNSASQDGGGIYNFGLTQLVNVTVAGNTAVRGGGASNPGDLTVANGTFHGNIATGTGNDDGGGGIFLASRDFAGALNLHSTTIANNHTGRRGGGIGQTSDQEVAAHTVVLRNSIVADNTAQWFSGCGEGEFLGGVYQFEGDMAASNFKEGHNVDEDGTCGGDIVGDPGLGSLAFNGGFVETASIGVDSNALDAADPANPGSGGTSCPSLDARGMERPHDGDEADGPRCDVGAYEVGTCQDPFAGLLVADVPGLTGTDEVDVVVGTRYADVITLGERADVACGGRGNDRITGGDGGDRLFGENGNDSLKGEVGDDELSGGAGKDLLDGGSSGQNGDLLMGGTQGDTLKGGLGANDSVLGEGGADKLSGGGGTGDACDGGAGGDAFLGADAAAAGCESSASVEGSIP
ncbi:MAG: choice-of-anchor Q domain-containing protein [Dehalococcoidia bacterium]